MTDPPAGWFVYEWRVLLLVLAITAAVLVIIMLPEPPRPEPQLELFQPPAEIVDSGSAEAQALSPPGRER